MWEHFHSPHLAVNAKICNQGCFDFESVSTLHPALPLTGSGCAGDTHLVHTQAVWANRSSAIWGTRITVAAWLCEMCCKEMWWGAEQSNTMLNLLFTFLGWACTWKCEADRSFVLKVSSITHSFGNALQPVLTHASWSQPPTPWISLPHTFINQDNNNIWPNYLPKVGFGPLLLCSFLTVNWAA